MIWFFRLKESFVKKTRQRGCENGALAAKDGPHHQITLLTNAVFADFFKSCEIWEMMTLAVWVGERDVLSAEGGTD